MRTAPLPRADGLHVVVTGATSGIGLAAAVSLARLGAAVTLVGRDATRGADAVERVRTASGLEPRLLLADLSRTAEVRRLAEELLASHPHIDVLLNNAGAINQSRTTTVDGLETTFAVNHLAPFLLTTLLLDRLRESAPARVVTVSSDAHQGARLDFDDLQAEHGYRGMAVYGRSKLANILFTRELARRLEGSGVVAVTMHPGVVATGFGHNDGGMLSLGLRVARPFLRSPEKGADTAVWLCVAPDRELEPGGWYVDRRLRAPTAEAQDEAVARRLWEVSEQLTAAPARA